MDFKEFKNLYQQSPVKEFPNQAPQNPILTVLVLTYQQASYIKDCLDGILMQKTDFPYEILIGEDDSNDGTREICIEYAEKYPAKIRLLLHTKENKIKIKDKPSPVFNLFYNTFSSRGKYLAICEGDDYWTDPLKLQKQVDFMESNPELTFCFHPTLCIDEQNPSSKHVKQPPIPDRVQKFTMKENIQGKGLGIWTVSMMSKSFYLKQIPDWLLEAPITDLAIKLFYGHHGPIGYIPDITAVYRRRSIGSWSENTDTYQWQMDHMTDRIATFNLFDKYSEFKYKHEIEASNKWWKELCLPKAYSLANPEQKKELIFNNLDYFLNLKHKGNLSRWVRFIFGDKFVFSLKKVFG